MSDHNRERSVSGGIDDSDFESHEEGNLPGKPGRKKNPNSQAARRDQNRIAQREFRLRKQQRIRDLEARVEILSGTKDEALGEMRNILNDLMAENHTLRGLLRSLASFVGDGAGGLLPKMGWDLQDFNNYINKGETDTAWESYQRRKKTPRNKKGDAESSSSFNDAIGQNRKRSADVELNGNAKKPRKDDKDFDRYPVMMPMSAPLPPQQNSLFSAAAPRPQESSDLFPDLLRGSNASPFFISPSSNSSPQYASPSSTLDGYSRSYMSTVNVGMNQQSSALYEPPGSQSRLPQSNETPSADGFEDDEDPKKSEAFKLIGYHLNNYKRNTSYCLPASLRPTIVQRTMGHESVIDRVLHPELRDRMILLRQRYDLADVLGDLRSAVTIHGDDVLAHQNWELCEKFIRKYSFLVDAPLLKIVNRWRGERGEPDIILPEENNNTS